MAPVKNGRVLFNSVPTNYPVPGETVVYDTSQVIDLATVPLHGGFLLKTLVLSIDPYLRGRMRDENIKSYMPAFSVGMPICSFGVGRVLRSEDQSVKVGDHIYGILQHAEYHVYKSKTELPSLRVLDNKYRLPWSIFLGAAGMPGKTAYLAWKLFSQAKPRDVVFVSAGAGMVGSFVLQLAKRDGLRTIASTGSPEKLEFLKKINVDVPFNYKETQTRAILEKQGPIDIYWDNVGGDTLEAALDNANMCARFLMCGAISAYNEPERPIRGLVNVFEKSLLLQGFIVFRLEESYPHLVDEFYEKIPPLLAEREIKYKEDVTRGLDKVGDVILKVQKGMNQGKAVVLVAEE
ncbi:hypothetical protein APHAL10511_004211 [Amanita phalloides]|nr:hypothetical protein APHAL10511_004211 [Amanita phalloides]